MLITLDARDVTERTGQARASAVAAEKALAQARTEQRAAEAEHRLAAGSEAHRDTARTEFGHGSGR